MKKNKKLWAVILAALALMIGITVWQAARPAKPVVLPLATPEVTSGPAEETPTPVQEDGLNESEEGLQQDDPAAGNPSNTNFSGAFMRQRDQGGQRRG